MCWGMGEDAVIEKLPNRGEVIIARDSRDGWVALFSSTFFLKHYTEKNPELRFVEIDAD